MLWQASVWVVEDSCPDYMQKAEEVLRAEEERVVNYLHIDSKQKLLQVVEEEILTKFELQLLEKEHSGCACLLKDDKVCASPIVSRVSLGGKLCLSRGSANGPCNSMAENVFLAWLCPPC